MTVVLETNELCRFFGQYAALAPTSFEIAGGDMIALTGPNGAGKSTLLLCLSGLLRPSKGTIKIGGFDLYEEEVESRRRLAFVPDVPRFYTELTAWEHLKFISLAHNADQDFDRKAKELLGELDLWEGRDLYPHNFSRGMKLKLGLALALIRPFDLIIMDEPASALDPQAIDYLEHKLLNLRYNGVAILLTTHQLEMVNELKAKQWTMEKGVLHTDGLPAHQEELAA